MRISRRMALGKRIPNELRLFWNGWVSGYTWSGDGTVSSNRLHLSSTGQSMSGDHGGGGSGSWYIAGTEKNADIYVDLRKYTKVHIHVDGTSSDHGNLTGNVGAGSVVTSDLATGERVLDISGIADRSNLRIRIHLNGASVPPYSDHAKTLERNNWSLYVDKVWVTRT